MPYESQLLHNLVLSAIHTAFREVPSCRLTGNNPHTTIVEFANFICDRLTLLKRSMTLPGGETTGPEEWWQVAVARAVRNAVWAFVDADGSDTALLSGKIVAHLRAVLTEELRSRSEELEWSE